MMPPRFQCYCVADYDFASAITLRRRYAPLTLPAIATYAADIAIIAVSCFRYAIIRYCHAMPLRRVALPAGQHCDGLLRLPLLPPLPPRYDALLLRHCRRFHYFRAAARYAEMIRQRHMLTPPGH